MTVTDERPATGYDATLNFRVSADLLPRLHAVARSRGLCAASFARTVLMEAVAAAEHRRANATPDRQEAA